MTVAATVELIPLGKISLPADDLRKRIDPAAIAELAASIKAQGLVNPLTLRKVNGGYRVVAGGRRFRALALNGAETAPSIVREDLTDASEAEIRLVENLDREDLTVLELAHGYKRWMETTKGTQEQLATRLGRTPGHVSQVLGVLRLPKQGQQLVTDGKLGLGHVRELQRLVPFPAVLAGRLAQIDQDFDYDGAPELEALKRDIKYDLEEAEAAAKAEAKAQAEAGRRKALEGELKDAKKAKDQKAIARLEKALAPPAADKPAPRVLTAGEKADRMKASAKARLTRQEKLAAVKLAPAFAKAVQAIAKTFKTPDAILEALAGSLKIEIYHFLSNTNPDVLQVLARAIARHLPGKWWHPDPKKGERLGEPSGDDAEDNTARRQYVGLWAWWQSKLEPAQKQLRAAAHKQLEQLAKGKAKGKPKAKARAGGRK